MGRVRRAWDDLRDRYSAGDPGLIRLSSALNTVGGILLTLLVLAVLGLPTTLLVAGAMTALISSIAVSDPLPRAQAVTLGLALPTAFASITLGAALHTHRIATDLVFLALIFGAVYIRRYGPRGQCLGLIAFQVFFVSVFTQATLGQLPLLAAVLATAFAAAFTMRFGVIRATPARTLERLRRAFRARLAGVVAALTDVAEAPAGTPSAERALASLQRRTARLHQGALMIQTRLEDGAPDPGVAAQIQRRVAEAEIAAERLSVLVLRALRDDAGRPEDQGAPPDATPASGTAVDASVNAITLDLHLPDLLPGPAPGAPAGPEPEAGAGGAGEPGADPALVRLLRELAGLRVLVARPSGAGQVGVSVVRNRLLGYRDDANIPDAPRALQDAFRGVGELARAMLGLRMAFGTASQSAAPQDAAAAGTDRGKGAGAESGAVPPPGAAATRADGTGSEEDDSPEAARSREELEAEDLSLAVRESAKEDEEEPTGLQRASTRAACQVVTGSALAILGGELLSEQRWYWAVLTCWVVFINTASTGEILIKGSRRLAGTIAGVFAGMGLATVVANNTWTAFGLVIVFVFLAFLLAPVSYALMSFFITAMLGLLYTLLHTYSPGVLVLRVEETALGSAAGLIAAVLILPVHTRHRTDDQLVEVIGQLRESLRQSVAQLTGGPASDLLDGARDLDTALDDFRKGIAPLTHRATPQRARRRRVQYILGLLETCAYHARSLAATAQLVPGSLRIGADPRLAEAGERLDRNLAALAAFAEPAGGERQPLETGPNIAALLRPAAQGHPATAPSADGATTAEIRAESTVALRVLRHLQRIDEGVLGLARPLGLDRTEPSSHRKRRADRPDPAAEPAGGQD